MSRIAVIDYGSGNLRSVAKALERVASAADTVAVTSAPQDIAAADRIVLPGVGAFADCARGLKAVPGLLPALERTVREQARPFLGLCVGMQLLADEGQEHGMHKGLGWIGGIVTHLTPDSPALKVPHMGWNAVHPAAEPPHPLFRGHGAAELYFVHSYHFVPALPLESVIANVNYGHSLTAAIAHQNIAGFQFHPEKSQTAGLKLLRNFLEWCP